MEKRYQVFVSSTYADLKDERQKVIQTLMELDCIPASMELFPAMDEEQFEFIKKIIDDCDYYLLIIGGRYGSITAEGISYTELEYEYALERKLKVIALLHKNPAQITFDKSEQNPELRLRLQAFRDKAETGRLVKYWQNAEELAGIVALSLSSTIKRFPAIGWVRANKVSNEELLIEINELRKKNAELSKALSEIEPSIFTGSEEKDFLYIYDKLNRIEEINVTIFAERKLFSEKKYLINLASLVASISNSNTHKYRWYDIENIISNHPNVTHMKFVTTASGSGTLADLSVTGIENSTNELLTYGFLIRNYISPVVVNNKIINMMASSVRRGDNYELIFSEKLERYKYWLDVTGRMPESIEIHEKPEC